ncbi:methyl-accepting chemotaxis protein [Paenibacillus radicis (ex Xue et al. 2023)]|uniref:Methyl-accepting chemotaxis protein n=1 Tax=Paenibacillus radicis (ex Xue et al. 2023) TaxID=2972489 RepID=A0ABT1YJQ5_9BACL|nr:methyl-accepting chemotaxis protein [Paenibacillus radicis (ex Xue et al. 2023)]MCR8633430.1 methyl-accepting chemotaxis protein [Paenibacillus radicis (ex Xue et al. 2023)]
MRFTIRSKLLLGFLAVSLLFLIAIGCNMLIQTKVNSLSNGILYNENEQSVLQKLSYLVRSTNADGAWYLMSSTDEGKKKYLSLYEKDVQEVSDQLTIIIKSHYHDSGELSAITTFDMEWNKYLKQIDAVFTKYPSQTTQNAQAQYIAVPLEPVLNSLNSYTDKLSKVIAEQEKEITSFNSFANRFNISVIVVTFLIAISLALILSKRIVKPVLQVNQQLRQIAEGEGDLTKHILVTTKDEIGDLALYFNQMINNLRMMIQHVGSTADQVAASSEQLTVSSEQSNLATEHIAQIMQTIASGSEKQAACLHDSLATINDMSRSVHEMASNIQDVSTASNQSSDIASIGNETIQTAIRQMNSIELSIQRLANIIKNLGERSHEIDQIASVITGISSQTHLLALNAAIEAARAGEQGKGFAAVAEEVKKLAEQSDGSAKQITELVHTILTDTSHAMSSMDVSLKEVNEGTMVIDQAGKAFGKIQLSVYQVSGQIQEVSAAIEEMAASADEAVNSIQIVKRLSEETAAGTQTVSSASQEQQASMEELSSSASYLARMAEQLQMLITKFKV